MVTFQPRSDTSIFALSPFSLFTAVLKFLALVKVQSKCPVTQCDWPDFLFNLLIFRMADFQDQDILDLQEDFEYDFWGDDLLGLRDQEEPMEQGYDSDVCIL